MKTYIELTVNEKINYKMSMLNKVRNSDKSFNIIKRIYQEAYESVDNLFGFVHNPVYFLTGGLKN